LVSALALPAGPAALTQAAANGLPAIDLTTPVITPVPVLLLGRLALIPTLTEGLWLRDPASAAMRRARAAARTLPGTRLAVAPAVTVP